MSHSWCRDISRDEQVRAAEDAAAVPAIQHRDLPEAVAALTERVAELTRKHNSLAELARLDAGWLKANEQRLTAERDAARAECERLRACADPFNEEMAVIAAWERCAIAADWPADEPETAVRCAASMEREIVRLRARVAELEAAANAGGAAGTEVVAWAVMSSADPPHRVWLHWEQDLAERWARQKQGDYNAQLSAVPLYASPQPPPGWLTAEGRRLIEGMMESASAFPPTMHWHSGFSVRDTLRIIESLLARETPPRVRRPMPWDDHAERDGAWIAAIREAGGEVDE